MRQFRGDFNLQTASKYSPNTNETAIVAELPGTEVKAISGCDYHKVSPEAISHIVGPYIMESCRAYFV
jgi:hypothetical protein